MQVVGGAESNKRTKHVRLQLGSDELECGNVIVIHNVFTMIRVVFVQLLTNSIKKSFELVQRSVGGVDIKPVLDHLQ